MLNLNAPTSYRLTAQDIPALAPPVPQSIEETGLPYGLIEDLVLRRLFLSSSVSGMDLCKSIHLPYNGVVETILNTLYRDKLVEFKGGQGYGRPYFDYSLTELGRERARDAFERCTYVGPAPVPLPVFTDIVKRQTREVPRISRADLESAFHDMVMDSAFMERLGPCVNSVRSLFLYGAPGNGKTSIAERIATILKGEIFVPHAIEVDGQVIKIHDPLIHREVKPISGGTGFQGLEDEKTPTDQSDLELKTLAGVEAIEHLRKLGITVPGTDASASDDGTTVEAPIPAPPRPQSKVDLTGGIVELEPFDRRFLLCYRPHVIVGGELTLEALDLTWSPTGRFYEAPFQLKACCGMMLIDDFGRQKVHPTDLLNRWIVPLEKRVDFLTLMTGKKFEVPFELLTIFSTNLDPSKLVDEAFLRRIRYKLEVPDPSERIFRGIFRKECTRQGVKFDSQALEFILAKYYKGTGRRFRGCHPRDILQLTVDLAKFLQLEPVMNRRLLEPAADSYFVHMEGDTGAKTLATGVTGVTSAGSPAIQPPAPPPASVVQPTVPLQGSGPASPGSGAGASSGGSSGAAGLPPVPERRGDSGVQRTVVMDVQRARPPQSSPGVQIQSQPVAPQVRPAGPGPGAAGTSPVGGVPQGPAPAGAVQPAPGGALPPGHGLVPGQRLPPHLAPNPPRPGPGSKPGGGEGSGAPPTFSIESLF